MNNTNQPPTDDRSSGAPRGMALIAGLLALLAGLVAWMWTGEPRWAVTGVAGLLAGVLLAAVTNREAS